MAMATAMGGLRGLRQALGRARGLASSAEAAPLHQSVVNEARRPAPAMLNVPSRLLMGPGPSNAPPRALAAMSLPLLGHMHPPFLKIMDEVQEHLRYLFQTDSKYVLATSGSGHSAMEACVANLVEPGDKVIVCNNGIWGSRVCDMAARFGGDVVNMEKAHGQVYSFEEIKTAIETHKPAMFFCAQGESSTGAKQDLTGIGEVCRENGTLFLVDTVCSLGGIPFFVDDWKVDAVYSGGQKVISAPPGPSPLMFGERAMEKLHGRATEVATYNADLKMIGDYWGWYDKRFYHHTALVSNMYAFREALNITCEEGLDNLWARHRAAHEQLWDGLNSMGLQSFIDDDASRLETVNTIKVPEGVDVNALIANAMDKYGIEISGGLGPTVGKIWRVGIMGYNCTPKNIEAVLTAFRDGLQQQGKL